jgi:hypothetical protein
MVNLTILKLQWQCQLTWIFQYRQVLSVDEDAHLSSYLRSPDACCSVDGTILIFVEL